MCEVSTPTPTPVLPTPTPNSIPGWDGPCVPTQVWGGLFALWCEDYTLGVQAVIPPAKVIRQPWPRGLVSVVNRFELIGPDFSNPSTGNWSPYALPEPQPEREGQVRNWRVGLRWERLKKPWNPNIVLGPLPPGEAEWDFDEREWLVGQCFDYDYPDGTNVHNCVSTVAFGRVVEHIYECSSADQEHPERYGDPTDKPRNGPDLDGNLTLASYQVGVKTFWVAEWATEYEKYECVEGNWSDCFCRPEGEPVGVPHRSCSGSCDGWYGKIWECEKWDWVYHGPYPEGHPYAVYEGWHPIDLRPLGAPNWYDQSWESVSSGDGENWIHGIPVPVIEARSILVITPMPW